MSVIVITLSESENRFGGLVRGEYEFFMETNFPGYYFEYLYDWTVEEIESIVVSYDIVYFIGFGKTGFDAIELGTRFGAKSVIGFMSQSRFRCPVLCAFYGDVNVNEAFGTETSYYLFGPDVSEPNSLPDNIYIQIFDGSLQKMKRNGTLLEELSKILN
jgi:hypothetical protein